MMKLFQIKDDTSYQEALKAVAPLVEKQNLTDEEAFFLNHQALEIEQWENDTPILAYKGDLKRVCPQKWIKTPERLLQVEKIDHIREVPADDGGGTLFVHVNGEGLYEPKLPFEEACKLLGYPD